MRGWPHAEWDLSWRPILWADDSREERPLSQLPPVRLFATNRVAILRSGWDLGPDSTDTVAAFYCHPGEDHTHYNVGDFAIWRGLDRLTGRGGHYCGYAPDNFNTYNYFLRTVAHNCLVIDDPAEPPQIPRLGAVNDGGQWCGDMARYPLSFKLLRPPYYYRGEVENFVDDQRFTYLFADLTPAYADLKARRVARAFLWLKPATFVICDWVESTKAELPKRWLLQCANKPAVEGTQNVLTGSAEGGILESSNAHQAIMPPRAQPVGPPYAVARASAVSHNRGRELRLLQRRQELGAPEAVMQFMSRNKEWLEAAVASTRYWRIEVEPRQPSAETVFLNVLDIGPADSPAPPPAALVRRESTVGADPEARRYGNRAAVLPRWPGERRWQDTGQAVRAAQAVRHPAAVVAA